MSWHDLQAEIAADFDEAQGLSPWLRQQREALREAETRAALAAARVPCSRHGCPETVPLYRPRSRHKGTVQYCSRRCKERANRPAKLRRQRERTRQIREEVRQRVAQQAPAVRQPSPAELMAAAQVPADPDPVRAARAMFGGWRKR